ncbi:MAG: hypothetical protein V4617_06995 [Gemmatimonadota bacterium]
MDIEFALFLAIVMFVTSTTAALWRSARKRAMRAESLVNRLLGERERAMPWRDDMRLPDLEILRGLHHDAQSDTRSDMHRKVHRETRQHTRRQTPHAEQISHSALDALALEVERIGEAQRFLTQALLERTRTDDGGRRVDPSRAATPH